MHVNTYVTKFVKTWKLREIDWNAPVVYKYDDMVGQVQKFEKAKTAGTTGGMAHIGLVIQVDDDDESTMALTYQEARSDLLKSATVRVCTEEERDTVVQERATDAWQIDARNVPGRSAVSGFTRSRWHPVVIRRTSEDAPTFKQSIKVQGEVIEVEEETMLKTFAVDVMWGDAPTLKKFQNKGDRDAQSKVFKTWFRRMGDRKYGSSRETPIIGRKNR